MELRAPWLNLCALKPLPRFLNCPAPADAHNKNVSRSGCDWMCSTPVGGDAVSTFQKFQVSTPSVSVAAVPYLEG